MHNKDFKLVKSKLKEYISELTYPDEDKSAVEEILRTPKPFVLCSEIQLPRLIIGLCQEAKRLGRPYCVIHTSSPNDIERMLTHTNFDQKEEKFTVLKGSLARCLEEKGVLLLLNASSPTGEDFNSILDGLPIQDNSRKFIIKISPSCTMIGVETATPDQFKISAMTPSWRDRFDRKAWLSPLTFQPQSSETETEEKGTIVSINCQFYPLNQLIPYLFHSYPTDKTGHRILKKGELAEILEKSTQQFNINLGNLIIEDQEVQTFIEEIKRLQHLKENYEVDSSSYSLAHVRFSIPAIEKPSPSKFSDRHFHYLSFNQVSILEKTAPIWWLNSQSVSEFYEFIYSDKDSKEDVYHWRTCPGFKTHFRETGEKIFFIVYQNLPLWQWYKIIHDTDIDALWVLDSVSVPEYFVHLFQRAQEFTEEKVQTPTPILQPLVSLYYNLFNEVETVKKLLTKAKENGTRVLALHGSSEHDERNIVDYDEKRQAVEGSLLRELKAGTQILLTGGKHLISKFPNLFNPSPRIVVNGEVFDVSRLRGQIIVVVDKTLLKDLPILNLLPQHAYESGSYSANSEKIEETGAAGIEKTLLACNPITYLVGEKATGKSYSVKCLPEDKRAHIFPYTLSASTTYDQMADVVLEWAKPNSEGDEKPRILVFEEVNLVSEEKLNWIKTMIYLTDTTEPVILLPNGKSVTLVPGIHLMFCLMNPETTSLGRHSHESLQGIACTVNFLPFSNEQLRTMLIDKLQEEAGLLIDSAEGMADFILNIKHKLVQLEPKLILDPRDLLAIVSRYASENYQPDEFKNLKITESCNLSANGFFHAVVDIIIPQLQPHHRDPMTAWLRHQLIKFDAPLESNSLVWAQQILLTHPELWNTSSSRKLMAGILAYLQTYSFYRDKFHKPMPAKNAYLILGNTSSGKTFLIQTIFEKFGLVIGKNLIVWNAGTNGDLVSIIKYAQQNRCMVVIHEINRLPTEEIEGAINALSTPLAKETEPGFGIILTANPGYNYRQAFSGPLLSRLKVIYADDQSPEDLVRLHNLPQKTSEVLLETHRLAQPLATNRGLLNTIRLCEAKIAPEKACAMTYGLLLQELAQNHKPTVDQANSFAAFLCLLNENRLVVSHQFSKHPMGEIDINAGQIMLPMEDVRGPQYQYDLIVFLTKQYQIDRAFDIKKSAKADEFFYQKVRQLQALEVIKTYSPGINTLIPASLEEIKFLKPFADSKLSESDRRLKASEFEKILEKVSIGEGILPLWYFAILCLECHVLSTLAKIDAPDWNSLKNFSLLPSSDFPLLKNFGLAASWLDTAINDGKVSLVLKINKEATQNLKQALSEFVQIHTPATTPSVDIGSAPSSSFSISDPGTEHIQSGAFDLPPKEITLARFNSKKPLYFPSHRLKLDDTGAPVLNDTIYLGDELPAYYFPKECKDGSDSIEITMETPLSIVNHRVRLFVPIGYHPTDLKATGLKLIYQQSQFYADYSDAKETFPSQPLTYRVQEGQGLSPSPVEAEIKTTRLVNIEELDFDLQESLRSLHKATSLMDQQTAFAQLTNTLKDNLTYLDRKDNRKRQKILDIYQKNKGSAAVLLQCLAGGEVVCIESAAILFILSQDFFTAKKIPIDLIHCNWAEEGEVTSDYHCCVAVTWPGEIIPTVYDPTPPSTEDEEFKLTTHFSFFGSECYEPNLSLNPILEFYRNDITLALQPFIQKLYKFTYKSQRPIFRRLPPGKLMAERDQAGLNPFMLIPLEQKWETQTFVVSSFPSLGGHDYEHLNCVQFLVDILFKNGFKFNVWQKKTHHGLVSKSAENGQDFVKLLKKLSSPTDQQSLHTEIGKDLWSEYFRCFGEAFSRLCGAGEVKRYADDVLKNCQSSLYAEKKSTRIDRDNKSSEPTMVIVLSPDRQENMRQLSYLKPSEEVKWLKLESSAYFIRDVDISKMNIKKLTIDHYISMKNIPPGLRELEILTPIRWDDETHYFGDFSHLFENENFIQKITVPISKIGNVIKINRNSAIQELIIKKAKHDGYTPRDIFLEKPIKIISELKLGRVEFLASGFYHFYKKDFQNFSEIFSYYMKDIPCTQLIINIDLPDKEFAHQLKTLAESHIKIYSSIDTIEQFISKFTPKLLLTK